MITVQLEPRVLGLLAGGRSGRALALGTRHSPSDWAESSGRSLLEVDPACHLPRHPDSAEEIVVVLSGTAEVIVGDERAVVPAGGLALVPKCIPHEVRNAGPDLLRFAAIYAEPDVVTTYERPVQPDGSAERHPVS